MLEFLLSAKYPALFIMALLEGPVTMAAAGFLLKLGYFSALPVYLVVLCGDLLGDSLWYSLGFFGGHRFVNKFGKFFGLNDALVLKFLGMFKQHEGKILFFSKLTMGFGFALATLIMAGMSKVRYRKFVSLNMCAGFIWTALLMTIGYVFGGVYVHISEGLRVVSVIGFILVLSLGLLGFRRYMMSRNMS